MNLSEFIAKPLELLPRISPSRYFSLRQCPLKELWALSHKPLLPYFPAAYVGTAIHKMLELAFQGRLSNSGELSASWSAEIERLEKEMFENPLERHLIPLRTSVLNYEVKRLLGFKMAASFFGNAYHRKGGSFKGGVEDWVQTTDGKVAGRIDLVKESGEGLEIVDYKTGALSDESDRDRPKEEYLLQVKMYAALYNATHSEWPVKLSLVGINGDIFSVPVDSGECSSLLAEVVKSLDDINELVGAGLNPEDFAQPSQEACRFCMFRPACNKYWKSRQKDGRWPLDVRGRVLDKRVLANGLFRIVVESDGRVVVVRGLSAERHTFLNDEIEEVVLCNLGNDTSDGFYVEKLFTTGYELG